MAATVTPKFACFIPEISLPQFTYPPNTNAPLAAAKGNNQRLKPLPGKALD